MSVRGYRRLSTFPLWLELLARAAAALLYRVRSVGRENFPGAGAAVLIANHLSYADVIVLQLASPRPLRFVAYEEADTGLFFRAIFRLAGVISLSPRQPLGGMRRAIRALESGEVICLFPEGRLSRTCQLLEIKEGFAVLARRARAPVVPAAIDGVWDSVFSFSGNRFLWKWPKWGKLDVTIAFGAPIEFTRADAEAGRNAILAASAEAFGARPALRGHLGREAVRALAARPWRTAVVDRTDARREVKAGALLAAAAALSRRLAASCPDRRIGIVLPPGAGAIVANLAVVFAGRIPVNLNFTSGREAAEASLRLSAVRTILTADAMRERLPAFPWPGDTRDLRAELGRAGGRRAVLPWLVAAWALPGGAVARLLGLPRKGGDDEAALLFTSGSSGEPRGVVLSHRNLIANGTQFSMLSVCPPSTVVLGCLPLFHSFGFTVTLWYPLLWRRGLVTSPSPLETRRLIDAIREEGVTVLVGAPTFVRPFLRKAAPGELASLRQVVTGAEKLPADLQREFREAFGIAIIEGYGLTEASPVVSVNQPDPPAPAEAAAAQAARKAGTVGRLLPGIAARLTDPDTGKVLPLTSTGVLGLRGANLFPGYLGPDGTVRAATRDGWYETWDLARFDRQGFLSIVGRHSRFSKIGGEMVPHATIEEHVAAAFGLDQSDGPAVFVAGVPNEAKGEALVLLCCADLAADEVRHRLHAAGLPNLWIPKIVRRVDRIPLLGTGKLDLAAGRALAQQAAERG